MEYPKELLKKIVQMGTLAYPVSKIINVLEIENEEEFIKDFSRPDSEVAKAYKRGEHMSDFVLDSKLFEMAKKGDLKALEKFEQRKNHQLYKAKQKEKH